MRAGLLKARVFVRPMVAIVVLAGLAGPTVRAAAEAPFFYDELSNTTYYDPDFDPTTRTTPTLALLAQIWSVPSPADPKQGVGDQDYTQQYRAQWNFTLDERSALAVEFKGASRGMVVGDDYFMKAEYLYKGVRAPMWVYGGIRVPNRTDFLVYGGVETMSYRLSDIFPNVTRDLPIAYKGFAEIRYDMDDQDPTLRLMLLSHTIPDWLLRRLTLGAGLDSYFREHMSPRWVVQGHAEYQVTQGFGRLSGVAGYAIDLDSSREQRLSLGVSVGLF